MTAKKSPVKKSPVKKPRARQAPATKKAPPKEPFWETKTLAEMTRAEWESLCDGCGRCCLNKFEDEDGTIHYTSVACKLLDLDSCRCSNYPKRAKIVPDCISLSPAMLRKMNCLPPSCAYRLLDEGKTLPSWHPLRTGRPESVHESGISVRGRVVSEEGLTERQVERRLVDWPLRVPREKE
jgi:uncharacterized cysteine cluster protein YcgN (CxxCxxCC family)